MKNDKTKKLLVLVDFSDNSEKVIKSAIKMAQVVNGEIELFHVRKPTSIVKKENTLSAVRVIKDHYVQLEQQMKSLINKVQEIKQVKTRHSFAFGNVKNEISNHIEATKPDIVVLGKNSSRTPDFMGDNVLPIVLKKYKGLVMIADSDEVLDIQSKLNLGLYNAKFFEAKSYWDALLSNTESPMYTYEIGASIATSNSVESTHREGAISYIFEKKDQMVETMSSYMDKNKVNLLLVNRKSNPDTNKTELKISELKSLSQKLKVPMLLANS
ncbi:universal stress protein [Marinirhabdus gelatinilytica]|uniref:Universal stress protein family protein n=1 Tax=Marinirhabdus gelatinilytica TaxID=1703343 RepID=A0A370QJY3_9FLAO|nr:universal stress protein [Marinirhabdus gelatinilytica]RDK88639.1 universal stress protein family protein [Marinirhabdus gelatinilytica]